MSARSCKYQSFLASQKSESPRSRPKGLAKTRAARRLSWGVSSFSWLTPSRPTGVEFIMKVTGSFVSALSLFREDLVGNDA